MSSTKLFSTKSRNLYHMPQHICNIPFVLRGYDFSISWMSSHYCWYTKRGRIFNTKHIVTDPLDLPASKQIQKLENWRAVCSTLIFHQYLCPIHLTLFTTTFYFFFLYQLASYSNIDYYDTAATKRINSANVFVSNKVVWKLFLLLIRFIIANISRLT